MKMLLNPKKLLKRDRQLKAVIGMGGKEFKILHEQFDRIYSKAQHKKSRKRAVGGGRQGVIKDTKSKLLFILMYIKVYPTYDLAGALFGVVASRPHEWVNDYLPILEEALGRHCVLPARKINSAEEFKRLYPNVQEVILDGAERPTQRPKNNKNQKKAYSGKKKRHTRKNIYLVNEEKKILYLSPTKSGKIHDFKQFKKTGVINGIPEDIDILADKGFIGINDLSSHETFVPKKKPKNSFLTPEEKDNNSLISSIRIKVEHAIGGVKRLGVATNIFRGRFGSDDRFTFVSAALWNFHLQYTA
jgi:hypothetical protein